MTKWQQACFDELQRQLDTMPSVVLTQDQFWCLADISGPAAGWDYEPVWTSRNTRNFRLTLGHAEAFRDQIRRVIAERVARQLIGT